MNPSSNMKAVLVLTEHKFLKPIILPHLNIERDSIDWDGFGYHGQSGGVQAALSWAYCLFCDEVPPEDWNYRDPFKSYFSLDRDIQALIIKAMAIRHGFISVQLEDRPKSNIELFAEEFGRKIEKMEARKNLKLVGAESRPKLLAEADDLLVRAKVGIVIGIHEVEALNARYKRGELNGEEIHTHNDFHKLLEELQGFLPK